MSIFNFFKEKEQVTQPNETPPVSNFSAQQITNSDSRLADIVINTIAEGICVVGSDGRIKMINAAGARMIGAASSDFLVGMLLNEAIKLESRDGESIPAEQNPIYRAVLSNQNYESRDYVLIPQNSSKKISLDFIVIPIGDANSEKIITFRDITKELEEENAQSEFISTASHEMRTPVASIEGYLGLALNPQTATIDDRARRYLESAHNSSKHLGRLFQDLLDASKLDDKREKIHLVPVELSTEVKKICDTMQPKCASKNIQLLFSMSENGGAKVLNQSFYSYIDVSFLMEILSNLIENAVKYSKPNDSISVKLTSDVDKCIISVEDHGIGIPNSDIPHIFQKFYRVDSSATREINGTGLGLYIVKKRVEAMNGTVWVESMYEQGSTFYVGLPKISYDEYNKRMIAAQNAIQAEQTQKAMQLEQAKNISRLTNAG